MLHDLSDPAVQKLTAEILARPEFANAAPAAPFWIQWLHQLSRWLQRLQVLHDSAPVLYWTIFAAALAASVAVIAHTIHVLRIAMNGTADSAPGLSDPRTAPDLVREARHLAAAGKYLEAGHRLMIASFHALADRSLIDLRPDRSNQWIRGAVRKSALPTLLADDLDALVTRTERHWFGARENDPDLYQQWLSVLERLAAAAR